MKKVVSLILSVMLVGFMVVGCGNSGPKEMVANIENGKVVYEKACIACHWKGVAGAAALSDKARWGEIAAKGMATIHQHSITGYTGTYGVMPERGTCLTCTDQDMFDAISYMMSQAGVEAKK